MSHQGHTPQGLDGGRTADRQLLTERLELRLLSVDDAEGVFAYASDAAVAEHTAWFVHESVDASASYITSVLDEHSDEEGALRYVWAICPVGEPEVLGAIDFIQHSVRGAHIHFALARAYWGRGIVTEATDAVVQWAFARLPQLNEILSGVLTRNPGAMRVLEKVGFRRGASSIALRPPKHPNQLIEATTFHLTRDAVLTREKSERDPR